ncbi:helix-turn-helix domain-containing protein [Sphingobacterium detergens]|uniref:Transcriptional regulator with XRE-family HTH domain n=1 Tax=Sphingobacterium detergens TaxID=1145106 RepID=A0A420AFU2_SPHD1|nr:helix-turn-helix transcriptional regulator [Sphingobacterium detergens]RKE43398.1 transcriptional regulator with XRE-family HTH domain [Sphingobacterium detergens]
MESQTVNQLIKQSRKLRGLTQQDLANQAGLSLRTVQRIEKGTEEISGFSLRQISQILEIPLEQLIMPNVNQISIDKNQSGSIKALYLASLTFLVNPLLGLLVPAIMGYTKQNKDAQYSKHLKKIIIIHATGLLFLGAFIGYIFAADFLKIGLPSSLNYIFTGWLFLLIPLCYYFVIIIFSAVNYFRIRGADVS